MCDFFVGLLRSHPRPSLVADRNEPFLPYSSRSPFLATEWALRFILAEGGGTGSMFPMASNHVTTQHAADQGLSGRAVLDGQFVDRCVF